MLLVNTVCSISDCPQSSTLSPLCEAVTVKAFAGRQLALAYKASQHGWSALQFHKQCDMKGPCVIYCETEKGARFGGFNSEGFKSSDDYSSSSKAFLFCWTASDKEPIMLQKVHSYNLDDQTCVCGTLSLSAQCLKAGSYTAYMPVVLSATVSRRICHTCLFYSHDC